MVLLHALEEHTQGIVVGVDEAGRGPWAGPVVAAAVVFDAENCPEGVTDSKKLTAKKRDILFEYITTSMQYAVGVVGVEQIDNLNILNATMLAMEKAVEGLDVEPAIVLVDGNRLPDWDYDGEAIVKGDGVSQSIAAASIVAKVTRDRLMAELASEYPHYGWERNSGYGTKLHSAAMEQYGISPHHRKSYAPVKKLLKAG